MAGYPIDFPRPGGGGVPSYGGYSQSGAPELNPTKRVTVPGPNGMPMEIQVPIDVPSPQTYSYNGQTIGTNNGQYSQPAPSGSYGSTGGGPQQGLQRAMQPQQGQSSYQQDPNEAARARQREQDALDRQNRLDQQNNQQQQWQNAQQQWQNTRTTGLDTQNTQHNQFEQNRTTQLDQRQQAQQDLQNQRTASMDIYNRQQDVQGRQDREAMISRIMGLNSEGGGGGASYNPPPEVQFPQFNPTSLPSGPPIEQIQPVNTAAADSATFARAKDQAAQTSQGALSGLRSALGGRGLLGSGAESRGTASIINRGQQEMGDVSRNLATETAKHNQENALANYQGGIAQRGQDIGREESMNSIAAQQAATAYQGAISQRGQNIQAQEAAAAAAAQRRQALQQALVGLGGMKF